MFKFNFRKEEEKLPISISKAIESIDKDKIFVFEKSYNYITKNPKAKIISGINALFTFIVWFIVFDFYRFYNGTIGDSHLFSDFYKLIPLPKDNLIIIAVLGFLSTYLTVFFLGGAIAFLLERLRLERHIAKGSIDTYLMHNKGIFFSIISLFFGLVFYFLILENMQLHQLIVRDVVVYIFMLITIFAYRYNKLVFKFSNYMKRQVLKAYIEAIESKLDQKKEDENN